MLTELFSRISSRCHDGRSSTPTRVGVLACAAGLLASVSVAPAGEVDPSDHGPQFKGWGTSLAWWANVSGTWSDPEEFESLMDAVFDHETGLGLTIVRLNIGAGQNPDLPPGYMTPGRLMPSYKDGPDEEYDFLADRAQQRVLLEGVSRGVRYVEANGNSPPWWMTITQDASGNPNGENLSPSRYDEYCEYLADVALWYRDTLGVEFSSITPLNEPSATWWDGNGNQEGCTFFASSHPALLTELRSQLDAVGLEDLPISGPEEWSSELSRSSLASYPIAVQEMLSHVTTHTYNTNNRAGLNQLSDLLQKPLWMSEYGTGADTEYESALVLSRRIIGDFREMDRLEAWVIWQVMSTSHFNHTWACMLANFATREPGYTFRPQYHAFRQFTAFIRPGSYMVDSGETNALAAYHPGQQRLTIVALNESTGVDQMSFDLGAFENLPADVQATMTTRTQSFFQRPDLPINNETLTAALAPQSVTTFVIDGVTTGELPRTDWNGDEFLDDSDTLAFLEDAEAGRDRADVNLDGEIDFYDVLAFLRDLDAGGAQSVQRAIAFDDDGAGLTAIDLGNGSDGGSYFAEDRLFVQAFNANGENGGAAIQLQGLTLESGVPYTVRFDAADFNQGWTSGGDFIVGMSDTEPGIESPGSLGSGSFSAPSNNGPYPMRFVTHSFEFTPSETVADPYLLIRTAGVSIGNQRFAIDNIRISR
jgi:O-glycosyl hydrolase